MSELLHALGINGKSLIFQIINFSILLSVLTFFVYRPLAKVVEARRKKIELGIKGGEQAETMLKEAEQQKQATIHEGEKSAVAIMQKAENEGQKRSQEIVQGAEKKGQFIVEEALALAARKKQEEMDNMMKEARSLIREGIVKTVELDPKMVDEKLIDQAIKSL